MSVIDGLTDEHIDRLKRSFYALDNAHYWGSRLQRRLHKAHDKTGLKHIQKVLNLITEARQSAQFLTEEK